MKVFIATVAGGLALLLAAAPTTCRAAVIYDNLSQTSAGSDGVGPGGLVEGPLSDSFSTGTGSGFLLTGVQLLLSNGGGSSGTTSIGIYTNNASTSPPSPGSLFATIGTVTDSSLSGTASVWSVSLGSPLSLAASTRYWVGLSTSNGASMQWWYASSGTGTGVANEFFSNNTGSYANANDRPYQMLVTVVPEPSLYALALVSLACSGFVMRRRPVAIVTAFRSGSRPTRTQKAHPICRAALHAVVAVVVFASTASAGIVDPVFVRGNRLNPGAATGVAYDSLSAFNSAADMASYSNRWWSRGMSSDQWGWDRWKFFDGTNYYRVEQQDSSPWRLHSYGSSLWNLMADAVDATQDFTSTPRGAYVDPDTSLINFFADSDGSIYEVWMSSWNPEFTDKVTKFDSVAALLAGTGTDYDCVQYRWGDNFIGLNGKFYRTNTVPQTAEGGLIAEQRVFGIAEYNSFADLRSGSSSAVYGGGGGLAWDLFLAVPREAVIGVPEPSCLGLIGSGAAAAIAAARLRRGRRARLVHGIGVERLETRINLANASLVPASVPYLDDAAAPAVLGAAVVPSLGQVATLTTSSAAVVARFTAAGGIWSTAVDVAVPSLPDGVTLRLRAADGLTYWNGAQAATFTPAAANVRVKLAAGDQTVTFRGGQLPPVGSRAVTLAPAATNRVAATIRVVGAPAAAAPAGWYAVPAKVVVPNGGPSTPMTLLFPIGTVPAGSRAAAIRAVGGVGAKPSAVAVGIALAPSSTSGAQARASAAPQSYVPPAVDGIAEISGNITRDTTFVAGTVYVITAEVHVWKFKTLTIEDGVEVRIRNGRGQFTHLTAPALIFDSGSSLVAQSVIFQAANDRNEPVNVADNGGVFFCGGTQAASKDNVSSEVVGGPLTYWSFQATKVTASYLGRRDPAGGDGNGPTRDDIDAVSVVGVVESEWRIASVESSHSGDDGFDLTNSSIRLQDVRVVVPTEDGVNLASSSMWIDKSLFVDMTEAETPRDREIFDFEVDNGLSMITVSLGADVNLLGFWDNNPLDLRIYLDSKDMEQPKPLERARYSWSGTLTLGPAFIYSPANPS